MKFDNHWLEQSEQEVTVHLKKRVFKYNHNGETKQYADAFTGKTDNLGCHEALYDLEEGKPRSMTVKVKKYGLSLQEKLQIVAAAALKEFSDDVNRHMEAFYVNAVYRGVPSDTEPEIVIEEKFLKWIAGETPTPYLDKDHKLQYAPPQPPKSVVESATETVSMPEFINERPPMTHSMWDVQQWVKKKQHLTTAEAMLASHPAKEQ